MYSILNFSWTITKAKVQQLYFMEKKNIYPFKPKQALLWWNLPWLIFSMFITEASNLPENWYGFNSRPPSGWR